MTPGAIASLMLRNGPTVEFFDFGSGAMVIETGRAGTAPSIPEAIPEGRAAPGSGAENGERLLGLWNALAPGKPVPKALADLSDRWRTAPRGWPPRAGRKYLMAAA